MATIKTIKGRTKLAKAYLGISALPRATHIAVGDGGVDNQGNPKALTGNENSLNNELIRKAVVPTQPADTTARFSISLNAVTDGLVNKNINEAILLDSEGDVLAIKTFTNKGLDEETSFGIDFDFNV